MAGTPFLAGIPAVPLVSVTSNPATAQNSDTSATILGSGRNGDALVSQVHGNYYNAAVRGNLFTCNAAGATGRTILAPGGTTSGFMFYNPVGSGVNMEIVELLVAPTTATDVVGVIGIEYGAPPTTVTNAGTVINMFVGGVGRTALCKASWGSTIVAMTYLQALPIFVQTTAGVLQGSSVLYRPEGRLVLAPGGACNIVSIETTQSTNVWQQGVMWAEWPV